MNALKILFTLVLIINLSQSSAFMQYEYSSAEISTLNSSHDMLIDGQFDNKPLTAEQQLENVLGPRHKPLTFVICMSTIYIIILLCGLLGNISTCIVIIYNNCMHTTTNYYLFSLAISDVLSLMTGLPVELYSIIIEAYPWAFGDIICKLKTFIFETTTIASVLTILTFTFERWLHICKAIYAKKFSSGFSRALKIILLIWLISGLCALPYYFTTGVYLEVKDSPESKTCAILPDYTTNMSYVIVLSVLFLFIIPMTLISIMYVLIGLTLWKSQFKHNGNFRGGSRTYAKIPRWLTRKKRPGRPESQSVTTSNSNNRANNNLCEALSYSTSNLDQKSPTNSVTNISIVGGKHGVAAGPSLLTVNRTMNKTMPRLESNFSVSNNKDNISLSPSMILSTLDRSSKDFEHITYRARQSRRDVVKMLCKMCKN
jgi:neuromedin U receptor 1